MNIKNQAPINSPKESKKILLIFHMDFLKKDSGVNMHVYEIAKALKLQGYSIDFLTTNEIDTFSSFEKNNENEKIVDNFYFVQNKHLPKTSEIPYSNFTWVDDCLLGEFQKIINNNQYDYIHIHYIQWLDLIKFTKDIQAKVVYTMHDMQFIQAYYNKKDFLECFKEELDLIQYADEVTCISFDEMLLFNKLLPEQPFTFLPHFLPERKLPQNIKDIDVLFLAYNNPHNIEGFLWFVKHVCPLLPAHIKITISGKIWLYIDKFPEMVELLKKYAINRIDFAEDLDNLFSRTKVSIVPMLGGTGLKIKTIDALARNIPIVTTLLGVDGFPDKYSNGCLVTDVPQEFATYIIQLINDDAFYKNTQQHELLYFQKYFSQECCIPKLLHIFSQHALKRKETAVDETIENILNLIKNTQAQKQNSKTIKEYKFFTIPVLRITKNSGIKRINLLGIQILKIIKKDHRKSIYLFGCIQIFNKKLQ